MIYPVHHPGRAVRLSLSLACLLLTFAAGAHAQTLSFSADVGTNSAPQSGGVVVPASLPNQTDYDTFYPATITGPAAREYRITSNTCVGQISGGTCMVTVVFQPIFLPPAGQTMNATLAFSYIACDPGPTNCSGFTNVTYSLVGTVTGTAAAVSPYAQIQITPTQPVLLQAGHYGGELARDTPGNLYATISNTVVEFTGSQVYTPSSSPTIIAGNGGPGATGDTGTALNAGISPDGLTILNGEVLVVDKAQAVVRDFIPGGAINLFAGTYNVSCEGINEGTYHGGQVTQGVGCYNSSSGPPPSIGFFNPSTLATDGLNVYVNDPGSSTISAKDAQGNFVAIAGYASGPGYVYGTLTEGLYPGYTGDGGPANQAQISTPYAMALDSGANIYLGDQFGTVIRKVDLSGTISTWATDINANGITFDLHGNMYAVQNSFNRVVFKSDGSEGPIANLYTDGATGTTGGGASGTPVIDNTGELLYTTTFNSVPGIYELLGSGYLSFPTVEVGTPISLIATISNPGNTNLLISSASIIGPNVNDFTISANDCSSINPSTTCTITVAFYPTTQYTSTTRTATLYLSTNVGSGTQVIALTGLTYMQPSLSQGRVFAPYYNWGNPSLAVASVIASGGVPPYTFTYTIPSSSGDWYLVNGTNTAQIDGTPAQVGPIAYTITVTDSEGGTVSMPGSFTVAQSPTYMQLNSSTSPFGTMTAVSVSGVMDPGESLIAGAIGPTGSVQMVLDNGTPQSFAIGAGGVVQTDQFNIDILFHTLTANYGGNTNYLPLSFPPTVTFNGNRPQSITFGGLSAPNGSAISLAARATSGLPATYAVTSGPGSIDYTGTRLLLNAVGTVLVTASQTGNPSFAAATPVTATFTSY